MATQIWEVPARISGGYQSGPSYNVWHAAADFATDPEDANILVADIRQFYETSKALYPNGTTITVAPDGIRAVDLDPAPVLGAVPGTVTADGGAALSAPQLALVLTLRTGLAGPSYRGRAFLGPLAGAIISNGQATAPTVSGQLAAANALRTALIGHGFGLVVWSRKLQVGTLVSSFTMNGVIDTLRSRAF